MGRKQQTIKGQVYFDFCLDKSNYVVQSNDLICSKQHLSLYSAKLIRATIMQTVAEDTELKPYIITIPNLSELLNTDDCNLYREVDRITDEILKNPINIKIQDKNKIYWEKFPWIEFCKYNSDVGLIIKLSEHIKPWLIQLKESYNYTQYVLDEILTMQSAYSIRIYELIQSKINTKKLPKNGITVTFTVDEIKEACAIDDKKGYSQFCNFRSRVLDMGVKEINEKTMYNVSYGYIKKGKSVVGINFCVNNIYH